MRLLLAEEVPSRLVKSALSGLAHPYTDGEAIRVRLPISRCLDRVRSQLDAACVLEKVPDPEPGWVNLLLTASDLFVPALTYVFGLSHLGGRRAVLSWARLRPAESDGDDSATLLARVRIEVSHELGHALGLVHCPVHDCAMHRSLWPESVDLKRPDYCPSCLATVAPLG